MPPPLKFLLILLRRYVYRYTAYENTKKKSSRRLLLPEEPQDLLWWYYGLSGNYNANKAHTPVRKIWSSYKFFLTLPSYFLTKSQLAVEEKKLNICIKKRNNIFIKSSMICDMTYIMIFSSTMHTLNSCNSLWPKISSCNCPIKNIFVFIYLKCLVIWNCIIWRLRLSGVLRLLPFWRERGRALFPNMRHEWSHAEKASKNLARWDVILNRYQDLKDCTQQPTKEHGWLPRVAAQHNERGHCWATNGWRGAAEVVQECLKKILDLIVVCKVS